MPLSRWRISWHGRLARASADANTDGTSVPHMGETPMPRFGRREMFLHALRALAIAAIGAVAAKLGVDALNRRDHTCVADGICRSCGRLSDCILPQAQSAREVLK